MAERPGQHLRASSALTTATGGDPRLCRGRRSGRQKRNPHLVEEVRIDRGEQALGALARVLRGRFGSETGEPVLARHDDAVALVTPSAPGSDEARSRRARRNCSRAIQNASLLETVVLGLRCACGRF